MSARLTLTRGFEGAGRFAEKRTMTMIWLLRLARFWLGYSTGCLRSSI